MLTYCQSLQAPAIWLLALVCLVPLHNCSQAQEPAKAKLFLQLAPEKYNTPDGMTLLPNGDFILSVPNFNEIAPGASLLRISAKNQE
ncbi:MAG: hypothetical protein ACYC3X_07305 [Pirellulaceae bacterium]